MRFLNWHGPDGLETIDELNRADFPPGREGRRAYAAELARLRGEYALAGMSAYWSGRPCAAWGRPFSVTVDAYSLEAGAVGADLGNVYTSAHVSPRAAARRLAELINGRTARAKQVREALGARGGRYTVNGQALNAFRAANP